MNKKQSLFKTILFYGYCIIFSAFLLINLLIALLFINNSIWEDRMVDGFILVYLVFLTQPITMPANIVFLIISLFLRKKNFKYIYLIWDYLFFGYLILVLAFLGSIFIENIAWQVPLHLLFLIITVVYLYVSTNRYLKANNKIQNHAGFKYSNKFSFFLPKSSFWISLFIVTFCNIAITGFLYYKNHDPLFEIPILYIASKLLFYFFILFSTFFFLLKKHRPNAFSLIVIGLLSGDTVFFIANDKINLLSDFNLIFKVLGLVSVIFMFFLIKKYLKMNNDSISNALSREFSIPTNLIEKNTTSKKIKVKPEPNSRPHKESSIGHLLKSVFSFLGFRELHSLKRQDIKNFLEYKFQSVGQTLYLLFSCGYIYYSVVGLIALIILIVNRELRPELIYSPFIIFYPIIIPLGVVLFYAMIMNVVGIALIILSFLSFVFIFSFWKNYSTTEKNLVFFGYLVLEIVVPSFLLIVICLHGIPTI